jgi:hypothetical protein
MSNLQIPQRYYNTPDPYYDQFNQNQDYNTLSYDVRSNAPSSISSNSFTPFRSRSFESDSFNSIPSYLPPPTPTPQMPNPNSSSPSAPILTRATKLPDVAGYELKMPNLEFGTIGNWSITDYFTNISKSAIYITKWYLQVGDEVKQNDPLFEVQYESEGTRKTTLISSSNDGYLAFILTDNIPIKYGTSVALLLTNKTDIKKTNETNIEKVKKLYEKLVPVPGQGTKTNADPTAAGMLSSIFDSNSSTSTSNFPIPNQIGRAHV